MKSLTRYLRVLEEEKGDWEEQDNAFTQLVANADTRIKSLRVVGIETSRRLGQIPVEKDMTEFEETLKKAEQREQSIMAICAVYREAVNHLTAMLKLPYWKRFSYFCKHILYLGICFFVFAIMLQSPWLDIVNVLQYNSGSTKK